MLLLILISPSNVNLPATRASSKLLSTLTDAICAIVVVPSCRVCLYGMILSSDEKNIMTKDFNVYICKITQLIGKLTYP